MVKEQRTTTEWVQVIGGFLAALSVAGGAAAKYFGVANSVLPNSLQIPEAIQSPLAIGIVLFGAILYAAPS